MKILALVTDAFGGYGGISRYNSDLLTAMAESPVVERIDVLPRMAPDKYIVSHGKIVQHRPIHNKVFYGINSIVRTLRKPDLIFNGHVYHGPLALRLARFHKALLVSQLHGDEVWSPLSNYHIEPLKVSDLVLCVSNDTRARYLQQGKIVDNSCVIPNTVAAEFKPASRSRARARLGINDETVILTVARLDNRGGYKGHDKIIRELPKLIAQGINVVYLIVGVGEDRERLESLAVNLGVRAVVRFFGKVDREILPDVYRAADVFALPSTGEGFGIAFLEAMACGTPAIGLDVGGASDALDGLGMCVPEEDFASALFEAVHAPRPDPNILSASVQTRFGKQAFTRRVLDMIAHFPRREA